MNIETTGTKVVGWLFLIGSLFVLYAGDMTEGLIMIAIGHIQFISADINEYIKGN